MIGRILAPRVMNESSILNRVRSQFAQAILVFLILGNLALIISDLLALSNNRPTISASLAVSSIAMLYYIFSLAGLASGRYITLGINILTLYLAILTFSIPSGENGSDVSLFAFLSVAAIAAALLSLRWVYWLVIGIIIGRLLLHLETVTGIFSGTALNSDTLPLVLGIIVIAMIPLLFGFLISRFIRVLETTANDAQRSADLLEATSRIGQDISQMLDQGQLLARSAELLRDRFGYYHVQIFLVEDDRRGATLVAATGEIGQQLLTDKYRVGLNNSNIGRVIRTREAIVAAGQQGSNKQPTFLASTRSQLMLPIIDGTIVIGVLDVHSMRAQAFSVIEIQALEVLTNQLANAIRNARLFEVQSASVDENRRLLETAEESLSEIQRLNRQLTRQVWEDFLSRSDFKEGFTLTGSKIIPNLEWSEPMLEASQHRRPVIHQNGAVQSVSVPVVLRGEILGAIEVEVPAESSAQDMAEVLQTIAQRFAINLDNARLFEETQSSTAQEQRIGQLVSQYQSADSIDELLQLTISSLSDLLGSESASIRLGSLDIHETGPTLHANGQSHAGGQT